MNGIFLVAALAFMQLQTAEQVYKNIQFFRGVPADTVTRTMQSMEISLGIHCAYCHGDNNWPNNPAADTERKIYTRKKLQMVADLNKNMFNGRPAITCNTCHRGHLNPVRMLPFGGLEPVLAPAATQPPQAPPAAGTPTVNQILDKYTAALGGADAIRKASNLIAKITVTDYGHVDEMHAVRPAPSQSLAELYVKGDKHAFINKARAGDTFTIYDGTAAWTQTNDRMALRELRRHELAIEIFTRAASNPARIRQVVTGLRVEGSEKIGDRDTWVVWGQMLPALPVVRMYFDKDSGLLRRMFYGQESSFCCHTAQTDFDEYLTIQGVTIPMQTTEIGVRDTRVVRKITDVTLGAAVEDSRFARPARLLPSWVQYVTWVP